MARAKLIEQLARFEGTGAALVAFESPRRIRVSLSAIAEKWPTRSLAMCRELTKLHEEVIRGTAAELLEGLPERVRGEIVLVLAPTGAGSSGSSASAGSGPAITGEAEQHARRALSELMLLGIGTKKAAGIVAELTGLPARRAYDLGLEVKKSGAVRSDTGPGEV